MILLALLLLLLAPAALSGQAVRLEGNLDHPSARLLREILARDRYQVVRRDTVLPGSFVAPEDLIVLGADVRLEGTVRGSVAVIDGALFVRPGARIQGPAVSVAGGGIYASSRAALGEVLETPPQAVSRGEWSEGGYVVTLQAPPGPPLWSPSGLLGLGLPTYDRVDGLTLRLGGVVNPGRDTLGLLARGTVSYHTARGALGGALAVEYPLRPGVVAVAAASRGTVTNDEWIRGSLMNTLSSLGLRSDVRDYYLSDEVSLSVARRPRRPLIAGEGRLLPRLGVRASRDRSVAASDPWSLFGDEPWRENPPVNEGTLASLVAGTGAEFRGTTLLFSGDAAVEWSPPGVGDFSFAQVVAQGEWSMQALWRHAVTLRAYTRQTLGTRAAPAQRWSLVGGGGTLPTLETGALRGDRVVLVRSDYLVPLPWPALPVAGPPSLVVEHAVGSAWVTGDDPPRWEQNLGVGLDFRLVRAVAVFDPARGARRPTLNLSASLPF